MFLTPVKMGQAAVGTGAGTLIYTAPTGITSLIKCLDACNTTTGALTLSVYLVPSGGAVATSNALVYGISIPASSVYQWTGTQCITAGGFIRAVASGVGLTINISGGEYAP